MERMFSKPFIAALEGHTDAVEVLARRPNSITDVASASWDGGASTGYADLTKVTETPVRGYCSQRWEEDAPSEN